VNKLGKFLAELEEEREWEDMRAAKRLERRRNQEEEAEKEEFEESSDEGEEEEDPRLVGVPAEDQEEVRVLFERRLLELFLDGLDVRASEQDPFFLSMKRLYADLNYR
jgi:hypothetical protein